MKPPRDLFAARRAPVCANAARPMLPLLPPLFALLAPSAAAQGQQAIKFSIDWKSASVSHPDTLHNQPMTEGDILVPAAPPSIGTQARPNILVSGQQLSLNHYAACIGHPGGTACEIEIDALSDGIDEQFTTGPHGIVGGGGSGLPGADHKQVWFSVDEFARGSVVQTPLHPQVSTEGFPPTPAAFEASADVFCAINLPTGPLPPGAVPSNNAGLLDGNGLPSSNGFAYPGLGLIEPNTPTPPANPGDNLDALDIGPPPTPGSYIYLSLDSGFVDPLTNIPNTGSAAANGFVGGDVLYTVFPGGPLTLYASAASLGLDKVPPPLGGANSDDLDALILWDNGNHTFQPSESPYDWVGGTHDMLIFSVRRGSAVIGKPDSIFNIPICEGDLLTTPLPPALGGFSPFPGIFIAAENLGLLTARGVVGQFSDELDAAEYVKLPRFDCNENGVEDSIDIANGASSDTNKNGIPDECEDKVVEFCWCPPSLAPCGNSSTTSGCTNSSSSGALLAWTGGTVNTPADSLVLTATHLPINVSGIMYMGPVPRPIVTFYDGLRCIGTPNYRYPLLNSGSAGMMTYGPGLIAHAFNNFPLGGHIDAGESWYFQCWYRDGPGPCGTGSNLSNVVRVDFQP